MSATKQDMDVRNQTAPTERSANAAPFLTPVVDLYEDGDGITLTADMPGVSSDDLDIELQNQELVIEGPIGIDMPDNLTAWSADIRGSRYRRTFTVGQDLDADNIEATMNLGVLTVRLPKKAASRTRRIEVK